MKPGSPNNDPSNEPIPCHLRQGQTELWKRYHGHGPGHDSEEDLIKTYLHLVKTVIGRLAINLPSFVSVEDMHSAGLIGLLNAIRNFDPKLGTAFEPYARLRIRGAALDELRRMDWVPRSVHAKARKIQASMEALEQTHGRLPTDAELAIHLGISQDALEKLMEEIRPASFICLDACSTPHGSEDATEHELVAGATGEDTRENVSQRDLARVIQARIMQLPAVHRKVLALYYFEDLRLREIAEVIGLCESRICQIHSQAILAIRSHIEQFEARANRPQTGTDPDNLRMAA